jgi:hypothetical protein
LGFPTGWLSTTHKDSLLPRHQTQQLIFWRRCRGGREDFCEGSFLHTHPLLCFIVLLYFIYFTCVILYQKLKKLESLVVAISLF